MKKLIFIFLFIPSICFAGNQQIINMMQMYSAAASSYDLSDFTFWWDCEAADFSASNMTTNYSAGDDIASANGIAAVDSDNELYGTNGLNLGSAVGSSTGYYSFTSTSIINDDDFMFGFALRVNSTWPGSGAKIIKFQDLTNNDGVFVFTTATAGQLQLKYFDDAYADKGIATVSGLSVDTWYFVIGIADKENDDVGLYIYNTSKVAVTSAEDFNTSLTVIEGLGFRVGYDGTLVDSDFSVDHIRIVDLGGDETARGVNQATLLATMPSTNYSSP